MKLWSVEFATSAARELRAYRLDDARFRPTLHELIETLKHNPLQFPTKRGKLENARAASLKFASSTWRLVFIVSVAEHSVRILSVGPHDVAYGRAQRRI
jgi:mRNA-degrading endonuclease RelE of RelBE toxin-antitoxin system